MNSVLVTKVSSIKQTLNILIDLAVNVQKILKFFLSMTTFCVSQLWQYLCESIVAISE